MAYELGEDCQHSEGVPGKEGGQVVDRMNLNGRDDE